MRSLQRTERSTAWQGKVRASLCARRRRHRRRRRRIGLVVHVLVLQVHLVLLLGCELTATNAQ
jgi:hypothetical protein